MNDLNAYTEIRVMLSSDTVIIPYRAVKNSEREVFPYRNLIEQPDDIDHIPELEGEPFMKKCVARLNSPEGLFETFRVIHSIDHNEVGTRQWMCLGFFFRDRQLFTRFDNCMMFAGNLLQRIQKDAISLYEPPLVELQHAYLKMEKIKGWVINIYVSGVGSSEEHARENLGSTLTAFDTFFLKGV